MEQLIDFHAPEVQAVLDTLLKDKSTGKNIIWATDPPEELQTVMYEPVTDRSQITTQQLRLTHYEVVLPRMMKQTDTQQQRTRKKGEVFSPAWVCNKMNNALDADWFHGLGAGETVGQFTVELSQGWQTAEPTGAAPMTKRRTFLRTRRRWPGLFLSPNARVRREYRAYLDYCEAHGLTILRGDTSLDIMGRASGMDYVAEAELREIYLRARYAETATAEDAARAAELVKKICE